MGSYTCTADFRNKIKDYFGVSSGRFLDFISPVPKCLAFHVSTVCVKHLAHLIPVSTDTERGRHRFWTIFSASAGSSVLFQEDKLSVAVGRMMQRRPHTWKSAQTVSCFERRTGTAPPFWTPVISAKGLARHRAHHNQDKAEPFFSKQNGRAKAALFFNP